MKKIIILFSIMLAIVSLGDAQVFNPQTLKTEISNLEKDIKASKTESDKYTGGMVKSLIDSRTQILANTKAMLEQRLAAGSYQIKINYTVDGKSYISPANKDKILQELEGTALTITKELEAAKTEAAKYSGGLVQAMKLVSVATFEQQLAMLEMKRSALIFNIPLYALMGGTATPGDKLPSTGKKEAATISAIDGMFDVKLVGKRVFEANYSKHLGFDFVFDNHTEKDIKAVQGSLRFTDLFDKEIKSLGLTIEKDVPAGQSVDNSDYSADLNQFSDEDNRLESIEMENLKTSFRVDSIIFKDGSIVKR